MSNYRYCHCGKIVVAYVLSTEAVAKIPSTWNLCKDHFRESLGLPPAKPKEPTAHPAYEQFKRKPPTCYGLAGACSNQGTLYASGTWCDEHSPRRKSNDRAPEGSLGRGASGEDHSLEAVDSGA